VSTFELPFGVTSEEIERITFGSAASGWGEDDRVLMEFVEELHEDATIFDATWDALATRFNAKQIFELIVLVGQFTLVTYFHNVLRLRFSPGNEGLRAC
jgi:hypothetical protein